MTACFIPDSAPPAGEAGDSEQDLAWLPNLRNELPFGFGGKTLSAPFARASEAHRKPGPATDGRRTSTAKFQNSTREFRRDTYPARMGGKEDRCGGRGFADLSPCVSAANGLSGILRVHWNRRTSATYTQTRFDRSLSDIPWDGDGRYPHSMECYGFESKVSPPAAIPIVGLPLGRSTGLQGVRFHLRCNACWPARKAC
jgi:hypothetical protein